MERKTCRLKMAYMYAAKERRGWSSNFKWFRVFFLCFHRNPPMEKETHNLPQYHVLAVNSRHESYYANASVFPARSKPPPRLSTQYESRGLFSPVERTGSSHPLRMSHRSPLQRSLCEQPYIRTKNYVAAHADFGDCWRQDICGCALTGTAICALLSLLSATCGDRPVRALNAMECSSTHIAVLDISRRRRRLRLRRPLRSRVTLNADRHQGLGPADCPHVEAS